MSVEGLEPPTKCLKEMWLVAVRHAGTRALLIQFARCIKQ